jgi:radical SAM superfamily enzyme
MRYYSLNRYCRDTFGEKLYKLSLDGGMTCPNRDGTLSSLGCLYCSAGGSGDFAADRSLSIKEQLSAAKEKVASKSSCEHFIAYFQAFTMDDVRSESVLKVFCDLYNTPCVLRERHWMGLRIAWIPFQSTIPL